MASPGRTCGYIQGSASYPFTCRSAYCGFNSNLGVAGCCTSAFNVGASYSLTGCSFITACYAATDIVACAGRCNFNTQDLLCSNAASPECVKYTFTDVSSVGLFCSDQAAVIDVALTVANAVATNLLSPSPGGVVSTTAAANVRSTISSATDTSSSLPLATTASNTVVATTGSVAAAGVPNPFTQTQPSGSHVGGVGTATPVPKGACGKVGVSRTLRLVGCFVITWALIVV